MADSGNFDLRSETAKATVARIVLSGARFGESVLFAHLLGPALYGAVYVLYRIARVLANLSIGWAAGGKKRYSESDSPRSQIVGGCLLVAGATAVVTVGGVLLGGDVVRDLVDLRYAPLYLVSLVVADVVVVSLRRLLEGAGRIGIAYGLRTLRFLIAIPLQAGLVLMGYRAAGFVGGATVAGVLTAVVAYLLLGTSASVPSRDVLRSCWRFSKYSIPNTLLASLYFSLDMVLLSVLLGTSAAGWYKAAWTITMPAMFVAPAIASGLMTKISANTDSAETVSTALGYASIVAIPLFFGAIAVGEPLLVTIYTPEYEPAVPLLVGLAFFQLIRSQVSLLQQTTYGFDRPDVVTRMFTVVIIGNIVLGATLTVYIGAVGVVIATVLAEAARYWWLRRFLRSTAIPRFVPREFYVQLSSGVGMFVVLFAIMRTWSLDGPTHIGAVVVLGGAIYFAGIYLFDDKVRALIHTYASSP